jgi:hypothetical protein
VFGEAGDAVVAHLVPVESRSSFKSLLRVHKYVLTFINNLRSKLNEKSKIFGHLTVLGQSELLETVRLHILKRDQQLWFPEIMEYFESCKTIRNMPNLVGQLNIFRDPMGLLRVKSKFKRWRGNINFPLLLSKNSPLSKKLILELHKSLNHSGVYAVLSELRKEFWIPQSFSLVKKTLNECVHCRRFNSRTVKLNQNVYRNFRANPPSIPFRTIFVDYFGPYNVTVAGKLSKLYILCITCLWSRAINLKLSLDLSVYNFLRALQLRTFEFGVPELI